MQVGKQFIWTKKEIDYLKKNYSTTNNKDLVKHFGGGVSKYIVINKANSLGLRKIYKIKCKDCGKKIIAKNHNVIRCPECQKEHTKKTTRERLAKLRKEQPERLKENYKRWYKRRGLFVMSRYQKKIKQKG